MGKVTNAMSDLLGFRLHLLIVILTLALCQTVSAADYLVATCDGPGGYCFEGGSVTVKYQSGADVSLPPIPKAGSNGEPSVHLGYCPTNGNGMALSGCRYLSLGAITSDKLKRGGWTWSDYLGTFTGTFPIPVSASTLLKSDYCIAAWVATHDRNVSGSAWLSFGENKIYEGVETPCVGTAPPPPPVDLCYINAGNPITVDFGQVERSGIGVIRDGTSGISRSISVTCLGTGTHTINVRLNMTATSWSASQIATSNPALGVALIHDGQLLKNGDSFNVRVQGSATQSLGFVLLRDPGKATTAIATGDFHASATLIVSEP